MAVKLVNVMPIGLRRTAKAVASNYGDDGAIIITKGDEGYRFGIQGLSPEEVA